MSELAVPRKQEGLLTTPRKEGKAGLFELSNNRLVDRTTGELVSLDALDDHVIYTTPQPKQQIAIEKIFNRSDGSNERKSYPDIKLIEQAILNQDYDAAYNVADILTLESTPDQSPYTWTRAALHGLSVPMYRRMALPHDNHLHSGSDLSKDIEATYGLSGDYLERLLATLERTPNGPLHELLMGAISEMTVFSLSSRQHMGTPVGKARNNPTDRFFLVPSTVEQDTAYDEPGGLAKAFDATLVNLCLKTAGPVQIKTSNVVQHAYDPSILVISTRELAGQGYSELQLSRAIIHDINGTSTRKELTLLNNAQQLLDAKFKEFGTRRRADRRILGSQAIKAL